MLSFLLSLNPSLLLSHVRVCEFVFIYLRLSTLSHPHVFNGWRQGGHQREASDVVSASLQSTADDPGAPRAERFLYHTPLLSISLSHTRTKSSGLFAQ